MTQVPGVPVADAPPAGPPAPEAPPAGSAAATLDVPPPEDAGPPPDGSIAAAPQIETPAQHELPPGWAPAPEAKGEEPEPAPPAHPVGGPNWMLAIVCGWAAVTSFLEGYELLREKRFRLPQQDWIGLAGYGLLGLGLLLFAFDALHWGRRRRGAAIVVALLAAALLTLAGVVCLYLFHDPGRRI